MAELRAERTCKPGRPTQHEEIIVRPTLVGRIALYFYLPPTHVALPFLTYDQMVVFSLHKLKIGVVFGQPIAFSTEE